MREIFLGFILISNSYCLLAVENDELYTVCSATINSSHEKEMFKKKLKSGKNKGNFNFIELTEFQPKGKDSNKESWFDEACKSDVKCDVLLISDHYGGKFFGNKNLSLKNDTLVKHSCRDDCSNILNQPKEVFLFGCNTLAGKVPDDRSPQEYFNVLVADGIGYADASRIVAERYGVVGSSFKSVMKNVFKDVNHLLGFDSIAPSGQNVVDKVKNYLNKIPDYANHLAEKELEKQLSLAGDLSNWNLDNLVWTNSMSFTNRAQCSGFLRTDDDSSKSKWMEYSCLLNTETSLDGKLRIIKGIFEDSSFGEYFEVVNNFLMNPSPYSLEETKEHPLFKEIKENEKYKEALNKLIAESNNVFVQLKVHKFGAIFDWTTPEGVKKIEKEGFMKMISIPPKKEVADTICNYKWSKQMQTAYQGRYERFEIDVKISDFNPELFNYPEGLSILSCLVPKDKKFSDLVFSKVGSNNKKLSISAMAALMLLESKDDGYYKKVKKEMRKPDLDTKGQAIALLFYWDKVDDEIKKECENLLKDKRSKKNKNAAWALSSYLTDKGFETVDQYIKIRDIVKHFDDYNLFTSMKSSIVKSEKNIVEFLTRKDITQKEKIDYVLSWNSYIKFEPHKLSSNMVTTVFSFLKQLDDNHSVSISNLMANIDFKSEQNQLGLLEVISSKSEFSTYTLVNIIKNKKAASTKAVEKAAEMVYKNKKQKPSLIDFILSREIDREVMNALIPAVKYHHPDLKKKFIEIYKRKDITEELKKEIEKEYPALVSTF